MNSWVEEELYLAKLPENIKTLISDIYTTIEPYCDNEDLTGEYVIKILDRLIHKLPITPLTETDDFNFVSRGSDNVKIYQCFRYPYLYKFMLPNGDCSYIDTNIKVSENGGHTWSDAVNQTIKVEFPYMPKGTYHLYIDYDEQLNWVDITNDKDRIKQLYEEYNINVAKRC